jgi:hypothetical protein
MALTRGSLSRPRTDDDNGGLQLSTRLAWRPSPALTLGVSAARGEYMADELRQALPVGTAGAGRQAALGIDAELARGHWILRGELVMTRWDVAVVEAPFIATPLAAVAGYVEGRWKMRPGLYLAARGEGLSLSELHDSPSPEWDAPVWRLELGAGWMVRRDLLIKVSLQHNEREGGRVRRQTLPALQAVWWF